MNLKSFLIVLFFFFAKNISAQINENSIIGNWLAEDHSVKVQVYKVKNEFHAKVLWFNEKLGSGTPMETRRDTKNPDPALRNRKIIGMEVLSGLKFNPKNKHWENGEIYEGMSGRTWDSSAYFDENGNLKVRGFWKFEWIGKSIIFKKAS